MSTLYKSAPRGWQPKAQELTLPVRILGVQAQQSLPGDI